MTWIIRRRKAFDCPYLRYEETPRTHATYDASLKVAKRYVSRSDAVEALLRLADKDAYVIKLKRRRSIELVIIRKEREALGEWILANVRAGIFMGPKTNADDVKLITPRDFVTLILAGAHVMETQASRMTKDLNHG